MGQHIAKLKRTTRTPQAYVLDIEKALEKKTPAPRHPTTAKKFNDLVQANPEFKVSVEAKNQELHKRLETIRVDSVGAAPDMVLRPAKKKLNNIRDGHLTYDEIEELFIKRKVSPEIWDEDKICEKYRLDPVVTENLLKYFSSFYIYKKDNNEDNILDNTFFIEKPDHPILESGKNNK